MVKFKKISNKKKGTFTATLLAKNSPLSPLGLTSGLDVIAVL